MQENNKRIAKNTIIVYVKLFVTMVVGLFTSRYVLLALGVSDYGLYNVVGSVIGLYSFIASSLSSTTIRFINYEKGKVHGNMNRMFNICNVLHICMAVLILLVSESFGIWYIDNYLNVAPGKMGDAMFVFQISIIVSCLGIINVPYSSLYNVHEKFLFPALLDIFYTLLRLGLVIVLIYYKGNALRFYAVMMSLTTLSNFIIYHYLAYRNWHEIVRWRFVPGWKNYKEVVSYSNYNIFETMAMTARGTGSNLLINMFFGTVVNAAYAVANTVSVYVTTFMASFDGAAGPQITQNIGAHHEERSVFLANNICRICIALAEVVVLPIFVEMDFILKIWLKTPPEGSTVFCQIMLFITWFASTSGGLGQIITGSGEIKWFKLVKSFFFLLCLPLGYFSFKFGAPAYTILLFFALTDIMHRIVQLFLMKKILHYDIIKFMKEAYLSTGIVFVVMVLYAFLYLRFTLNGAYQHILGLIVSTVFSCVLVFFAVLRSNERHLLIKFLSTKLHF